MTLGLDRHDVGVGGGRVLAGMQLARVDAVGAAIGADKLTGLVLTDQAHGLEGEMRLEPRQIEQQVVRAAAVTGGLLEDVGQRVLGRINVDDLRPIDDPVSACQDSVARHGGFGGKALVRGGGVREVHPFRG